MKMRRKNPSENLTTPPKEAKQPKNTSTNSDSQSAKLDYQPTTTWSSEPSERDSSEPSPPESYIPTRNLTLLKTPLPRKDGTPSPSSLTEYIETTFKLSAIDQTNRWDNNRIFQINSNKFTDENMQLDQLIKEETNPNHDMIQTPWTSTSFPLRSTQWPTNNEESF